MQALHRPQSRRRTPPTETSKATNQHNLFTLEVECLSAWECNLFFIYVRVFCLFTPCMPVGFPRPGVTVGCGTMWVLRIEPMSSSSSAMNEPSPSPEINVYPELDMFPSQLGRGDVGYQISPLWLHLCHGRDEGGDLSDDQKGIHPEVAPSCWLQDVWKPGGGRCVLGTAALCLRKHPAEGWLFFH